MPTLKEMQSAFPRVGRLDWIGAAAERRGEVQRLNEAQLVAEEGIAGEHHARRGTDGAPLDRQVTLIQSEHLPAMAALLGRDRLEPEILRRNLAISGINLKALKHRRFRIGACVLEGSGNCPPCSRMEEALGPGGYNAMRGHGGITARIITGGAIGVGDEVTAADE
jgi:MOSC domain-containing protein YiiM